MNETLASQPIGVFDSGVGGLTVVKELNKIMPYENIVYFGDTARLPYGSKSEETIIKYSLENTIFLHSKKVKLVVIACNTASAVSLDYLRNFIKMPMLGVVECGSLGAVRATRGKKIGVIGTKATIKSGAYTRAIKRLDQDIEVFEVPTPLLVHLVEEDWIDKDITKTILLEYLAPLFESKIDTLILGCTHYPFLVKRIRELSSDIIIVDSSIETSHLVLNTLLNQGILSDKQSPATVSVYLSDAHPNFLKWARDLLEKDVNLQIIDD
jgi:glutamate racemase